MRSRKDKAEDRAGEPPAAHDETPGQRPARGSARARPGDGATSSRSPSRPTRPASPRCCSAATCRRCITRSSDVREGHHGASHDDLSDGYERISRFHLGQLAYLATRLDAMPEGEGTVLDNSCLIFLSNMWAGWKHDNMKLPVVTAGGLGGTLATGRALDYLPAGDENRRALQPVPVDHGPHGRQAGPLRRRHHPPGEPVTLPAAGSAADGGEADGEGAEAAAGDGVQGVADGGGDGDDGGLAGAGRGQVLAVEQHGLDRRGRRESGGRGSAEKRGLRILPPSKSIASNRAPPRPMTTPPRPGCRGGRG